MAVDLYAFNVIVLAGGQSSRMGHPKFLLPHVNGRPSYVHIVETIHQALPDVCRIVFLLHEPSQRPLVREETSVPLEFSYDQDATSMRSGPATGLAKAMELAPSSHWLLYPCDYPLMTPEELRRLRSLHQHLVTCFEDAQGRPEPLLSIWSPVAIAHGVRRNAETRDDLRSVIEALNGTRIRPMYDHSLFNTNTPEEWAAAMALLGGSSKG
jgi:molybdopterin-guanine dinucleotide biosynthesis protein A